MIAFPRITRELRADACERATIRQLARALDQGAFKGDHGPGGFVCPRCSAWAAEVLSDRHWACRACRFTGSDLGLAQLVAADWHASVRLARVIHGEAITRPLLESA